MADNTVLNPGSGGDVISTDDLTMLNGAPVSNVKAERVKVGYGVDAELTDVNPANPLPVTDAVSEAALTSLAAEDFATHTAQIDNSQKTQLVDASGNNVTVTGNKLDVNATFSGDIEIGAVEIKNSTTDDRTAVINTAPTTEFGLVTRNIPSGTQPVSAVSLPLPLGAAIAANQQTNAITDAQIRATPLPVSGTVSTGLTQPLTDVQLRATPVPVSGTVATSGLTDVQLRATPVPISGTVAVTGSGDATAANQVTGNNSLASILAKIITAPSTEAKQDTIITALATLLTISDFDLKTGSLTETAPATDTASSGLNGRLQRIAQRLTSLIALLPAALGAGGGLKIDGSGTALPISGSIGNTTFAATQATAASLNMTEASAAAILAKLTAAAASFVKLEDVASVDADAGVPMLAVRKATPANTSGSDGDYEFLQMSAGKLWVQAGATQKPSIGATVVLAVTALQSLASSATVGWGSVRVSNLTTLATDYEIFVKLTTANTAPANDKAAYIWVCPFYTTDAGSTWFASSQGTTTLPTGTDAASTIASPHNLRLLGVLNYTTQQMVLQDTFLLSNCFGNRMPDGFSIIITNFTGAALSTGCVVDYSPINDILV